MPHLQITELAKFPIKHPSLQLQQRFAKIIDSIQEQKEYFQKHLTEIDFLFASLQERAFKGEL